jgi:hypothetical protein
MAPSGVEFVLVQCTKWAVSFYRSYCSATSCNNNLRRRCDRPAGLPTFHLTPTEGTKCEENLATPSRRKAGSIRWRMLFSQGHVMPEETAFFHFLLRNPG